MVKSLRLLIFCITLGSPTLWWWKCTPPTCLLLNHKGKRQVGGVHTLSHHPMASRVILTSHAKNLKLFLPPPLLILTQLCGEEALLLLLDL